MMKMQMTVLKPRMIFPVLIPLLAILVFVVSCTKNTNTASAVTAVELVKMNVIYIGVENPVKIAVSGLEAQDIEVSIDNGTITGKDGEYLIRPGSVGMANLLVSHKGQEIQKTRLRVKSVPDPVAGILKGTEVVKAGEISKHELLEAGGITSTLRNFDFDLSFSVVSFVLSVSETGSSRTEPSSSDRFTDSQLELIHSLKKGQELTVEDVYATGPDGNKRKLNSFVLKINGD